MSGNRRGKFEVDLEPQKLVSACTLAEKNQLVRDWLRKVRRSEYGMPAKRLGEAAGLVESTITRFERGDRNLSADALERVEKAIGALIDQKIKEETLSASSEISEMQELLNEAPRPRPRLAALLHSTSAAAVEGYRQYYESGYGSGYGDRSELNMLKQQLAIAEKLIASQDRIIELQKEGISELTQESVQLKKQVADLRALYDAGTEAALANARFEELREKVSIKGEEE